MVLVFGALRERYRVPESQDCAQQDQIDLTNTNLRPEITDTHEKRGGV
jgi:hypothetical protein